MRLRKLEIYGFKSFPEKTEFQFDEGITAIVGPNGSGKSNVADAVRWVLGEQSAKSLRGGRMEDIIFSGTEKRKALSFAEVTLTLDNSDNALPVDFSEVSVTRRVYRSGESEYRINKTSCRLRDIVELFMDTGVGKEGYSIIGQGRIDEILSARSEDRRAVFEEAAGVVKYKSRKDESERKLEHTRRDLQRMEDVLHGMTELVPVLEEQAAGAKEFIQLRDRQRDLEVNAFLYQYDRGTKRRDEIEKQLAARQGEQSELEQMLANIDASTVEERAAIRALETRRNQLRQTILDETTRTGELASEVMVMEERIKQLDNDAARDLREEAEQENQLSDAARTRMAVLRSLETRQDDLEAQRTALTQAKEAQGEQEAGYSQHQRESEQSKELIMNALQRLSDVRARQERFRALEGALISRQSEMTQSAARREEESHEIDNRKRELTLQLTDVNEHHRQVYNTHSELARQIQTREQEMAAFTATVQRCQSTAQADASRLALLQDMKRDYEGYQHSVRRVLAEAKRQGWQGVYGVVGELIHVDARFETAMEVALGGAVQNIVTESDREAKQAISFLRAGQWGRATFLPLTDMKGRLTSQEERRAIESGHEGVLGIASELAECDGKFRSVIDNLLGRTVIVDTLDTGVELARRTRHTLRIVTLQGDVLHSGGSMTGGSLQAKTTSFLSRDREITALETSLKKLQDEGQAALASLNETKSAHAQLTRQAAEQSREIHRLELDKHGVEQQLAALANEEENVSGRRQRLEQETIQLENNLKNVRDELAESTAQEESLFEESEKIRRESERFDTVMSDLTQERAALSEQLTNLRVTVGALEKEIQLLEESRQRAEQDETAGRVRIARLQQTAKERAETRVEWQRTLEEMRFQLDVDRSALWDIQAEEEQTTAAIEKQQDGLSEVNRQKDDIHKQLTASADRRRQLEVQLSRLEIELETGAARIWEEYELTYANALPFKRADYRPEAGNNELLQIKEAISAMGNINVGAIEELTRVNEKISFLQTQKEDLAQAEQDLQIVIDELMDTMRTQFEQQFEIINEHFANTFRRLFGGGTAELVMQKDEDGNIDVLSCGIDIIAQPPGKRLQNLSLMSGGERALTAIAILFAILTLKPTPFCILDEIEAALDENNVGQFAAFLGEFAKNTQFVVITHRKGTMEVGDILYGIAMEEKGVSRQVSVKLSAS